VDQLSGLRLYRHQPGQRLVQRQQVFGALRGSDGEAIEVEPLAPAAPLDAAASAGAFDEDAAHGLGGGGEEVPAAVPRRRLVHVHQAKVRLMHQRRGLERLPRLLLGEPLPRQPAQLVVDQRQQLIGGLGVALFDGGKDARDLAHAAQDNRRPAGRQTVGRAEEGRDAGARAM
jgi:hypothetical protein